MTDPIETPTPAHHFFFTARLADRASTLLLDEVEALRCATRAAQNIAPFSIQAAAVLPNVLHAIWSLPSRDHDFRARWEMVKSCFADRWNGKERTSRIWIPSVWVRPLSCRHDILIHRRFIHASPVTAGYCRSPDQWPHSSVHRDRLAGGASSERPGSHR